jgi:hypothetical protein
MRWFAVWLPIKPASEQTQRPTEHESDKVENGRKKFHAALSSRRHQHRLVADMNRK